MQQGVWLKAIALPRPKFFCKSISTYVYKFILFLISNTQKCCVSKKVFWCLELNFNRQILSLTANKISAKGEFDWWHYVLNNVYNLEKKKIDNAASTNNLAI